MPSSAVAAQQGFAMPVTGTWFVNYVRVSTTIEQIGMISNTAAFPTGTFMGNLNSQRDLRTHSMTDMHVFMHTCLLNSPAGVTYAQWQRDS